MKPVLPVPCLMLVTEPWALLPQIIRQAVSGGVDVVQWRDKDTPKAALREQAEAMRSAMPAPKLLMTNHAGKMQKAEDRNLMQADGLHLPESGQSVSEVRQIVGPDLLIGCSVHSVEGAKKAADEGADYLLAGTTFASQSHPEVVPRGWVLLAEIAAVVDLPLLAIGGITPQNLGLCLDAGTVGVAVLSPIMQASDPRKAAQAYRTALDEAWSKRQ